MTEQIAVQIAKRYIRQELRLHPIIFKTIPCSDDESDKIMEFSTEEGTSVEVCIRPRYGQIISKSTTSDGQTSFEMAGFAVMSVRDVLMKLIENNSNN